MLPSGYMEGGLAFAALLILSLTSSSIGSWRTERRARRRTLALQALATNAGLAFSPARAADLELPPLPLLRRGDLASRVHNFLDAGACAGARLYFCDFTYTNHTGKSSVTSLLTLALAVLDSDRLPAFSLSPEGFFDKAEQLLGRSDIDFPEAPGFSGKYQLQAPSEEQARLFFTPRRLQALESRPGWHIQGAGRHLLFTRAEAGDHQVSPGDYPAFVAEVKELLTELN